jgi:hypothetical protein
MKRSVLWTFLVLASLLFATACEQPAGTGGGGPKITLGSAEELRKIGVDPGYPLDAQYTLGADLALADWTPIGTADEPFAGTFDGDGKTLAITGSGGLFGFAGGAVIRNLTVGGSISASGGGMIFVGGIVGRGEDTKISSCVSRANIVVEAQGHNSSAGGIAGFLTNNCAIADCSATGDITLRSGEDAGLMLYAGGIAGYQGLAGSSSDGFSGCVIERSFFTGNVSAEGSYPYAGGIAGYNYVGAIIRESYAAEGSVTARGEIIPYAGGISGYNSRNMENPSLIENCHSNIRVSAEAESKQAQAGGIAGANAASAAISKCYSLGAVAATVNGSGDGDTSGSIGVAAKANAGGIAGAQYFDSPSIKNCAALNTKIEGRDSGAGAAYNVHRIAGLGEGGEPAWEANIARADLSQDGVSVDPLPEPDGYDGKTCDEKPPQSAYEALGWDFNSVWKMGGDGYPVLQWRRP